MFPLNGIYFLLHEGLLFFCGTLPETNSSPLENQCLVQMTFPLGAKGLSSGQLAVSFREGTARWVPTRKKRMITPISRVIYFTPVSHLLKVTFIYSSFLLGWPDGLFYDFQVLCYIVSGRVICHTTKNIPTW